MTERHSIRWTTFAGILFTIVGMCLLNYYSLFPNAEMAYKRESNENDDAAKTRDAANIIN